MSSEYMAGMGAMSSGMDPVGQPSRGPSDEGGTPVPTFRPPAVQQPRAPQKQNGPAPPGAPPPDILQSQFEHSSGQNVGLGQNVGQPC